MAPELGISSKLVFFSELCIDFIFSDLKTLFDGSKVQVKRCQIARKFSLIEFD